MRRQFCLAATTVLFAASASAASAAVLDVRASYKNDTDASVQVAIGGMGSDDVRTLDPGDTISDVTLGRRTLKVWFRKCMGVELENPLVGRPGVAFMAFGDNHFSRGLSEGETRQFGTSDHYADDPNVKTNIVSVRRLEDTDDYKEFAVVLRACKPSEKAERPHPH